MSKNQEVQTPPVSSVEEGRLLVLADFLSCPESVEQYCARTWRDAAAFRRNLEALTAADLRTARLLVQVAV